MFFGAGLREGHPCMVHVGLPPGNNDSSTSDSEFHSMGLDPEKCGFDGTAPVPFQGGRGGGGSGSRCACGEA